MKRLPTVSFCVSVALSILSIVLLVVFKLSDFTNMYAAYIVAACAMLGGIGLVVSELALFFQKENTDAWTKKLAFHLPEIIAAGLVVFVFGFILFWGGVIR